MNKIDKIYKKIVAIGLAFMMAMSGVVSSVPVMAESSGTIGGCTWEIDDEGVLTIAPDESSSYEGWLYTSGTSSKVPWIAAGVEDTITSVVFEDGVMVYQKLSYLFKGCENLTSVDFTGVSTVSGYNLTLMQEVFSGCTSLKSVNFGELDTSSVTNMAGLFYNCDSLNTITFGDNFNTESVTTMYSMFEGCSSLKTLDLSSFDTSSVTTMAFMFNECSSLTSITFGSSFNTASVTNMYAMFRDCSSLISLDVSSFDTSNVTTMYVMFKDCSSLISLDVSSFDTSNVTTMFAMFERCSSIKTLNLSNFDTSNVTDMSFMFNGCSGLTTVTFGDGFVTSNVISMYAMFKDCTAIISLDLSTFSVSDDFLEFFGMVDMLDGVGSVVGCRLTIGGDFYFIGSLDIADTVWQEETYGDTYTTAALEELYQDAQGTTLTYISISSSTANNSKEDDETYKVLSDISTADEDGNVILIDDDSADEFFAYCLSVDSDEYPIPMYGYYTKTEISSDTDLLQYISYTIDSETESYLSSYIDWSDGNISEVLERDDNDTSSLGDSLYEKIIAILYYGQQNGYDETVIQCDIWAVILGKAVSGIYSSYSSISNSDNITLCVYVSEQDLQNLVNIEISADVTFTKTDENGIALSDDELLTGEFTLYGELDDGSIYGTGTIRGGVTTYSATSILNKTNSTTYNLSPGEYTFTEESSPDGYEDQTVEFSFTVSNDGTVSYSGSNSNVSFTKSSSTNFSYTFVISNTTEKIPVYSIQISKKDVTSGDELEGATLTLSKADGTKIATWTSDGTVKTFSSDDYEDITEGDYVLTETSAPDGYILNSEYVEFTISVDDDGNVTVSGDSVENGIVVMYNDVNSVNVGKRDYDGKGTIDGAVLVVKNISGTTVDTWTSGDDGTETDHTLTGLSAGTYYITETSAPDGYELSSEKVYFTISEDGTVSAEDENLNIKVDDDGNVTYTVLFYNTQEEEEEELCVEISKQDIAGDEVIGAKLEILDENDEIVEEWISTASVHTVVLDAGTYTLRETLPASGGYTIADDIEFTLNEDGTVTCDNLDDDGVIVMTDELNSLSVSKQDLGGNEIGGATITITDDSTGLVVYEWTSVEGETHIIEGISEGSYTLKETVAPDGYVLSEEEVTFIVNEYGIITVSKGTSGTDAYTYLQNSPEEEETIESYVVYIKKVCYDEDSESYTGLAGAGLQLTSSDGTVISSWTSTVSVKSFELEPDTYTITETSTPSGYLDIEDIIFTIDDDGDVSIVDGDATTSTDPIIISVINELDTTPKTVAFKKLNSDDGYVSGATLEILDMDGEIVEQWESGSNYKTLELEAGEYYFHEEDVPDGYIVADDIYFVVNYDGTVDTEDEDNVDYVVMYDDYTVVNISKLDAETDEFVEDAILQILDEDESVVYSWTTDDEEKTISGVLSVGETYILREYSTPDGYVTAEDIYFTINEDGTVDTEDDEDVDSIIMYDEYTNVEVSKLDSETGEFVEGATLKIIDSSGSVVYSWETEDDVELISGVLSAGETYTLRETIAPDGYDLADEVEFTVNEDTETLSVYMYDTPEEVEYGILQITKVVSGDGDTTKSFEFVMTLYDEDGSVYEDEITYITSDDSTGTIIPDENGQLYLELADGEAITFYNIVVGSTYEIYEQDYSAEGYISTVTTTDVSSGSSSSGFNFASSSQGDGLIRITFTNTYSESTSSAPTPETPTSTSGEITSRDMGDNSSVWFWLFTIIATGWLLGSGIYLKKKRFA